MENSLCEKYSWITSEFVQILIEKWESNAAPSLKSFSIKNALALGENFCSTMLRLSVIYTVNNFQEKEIKNNFIIKANQAISEFDKAEDGVGFFHREINVYSLILPVAQTLLNAIEDNVHIAPRCIATGNDSDFLIFEDLSEQGFQNTNKKLGLDETHLKITLATLAKWHAATAVLKITNNNLFDYLQRYQWSETARPQVTDLFFKNIAKTMAIISKTWTGFENISNKLANLTDESFSKGFSVIHGKADEEQFNCLTHGDLWTNNIMFKYDGDACPIDVRLVDFAIGTFSTPAIDLFYLLYSSAYRDISEADRERLIQFYHVELVQCLRNLQYTGKMPKLMDIHIATLRCSLYLSLSSFFIIGLRHMKKTIDSFLVFVHDNEENYEYRIKLLGDPDCSAELQNLLRHFDEQGHFDS